VSSKLNRLNICIVWIVTFEADASKLFEYQIIVALVLSVWNTKKSIQSLKNVRKAEQTIRERKKNVLGIKFNEIDVDRHCLIGTVFVFSGCCGSGRGSSARRGLTRRLFHRLRFRMCQCERQFNRQIAAHRHHELHFDTILNDYTEIFFL
jgi:hypothetical protein